MKLTVSGAIPDVRSCVKPATGAVGLVTLIWRDTFDAPPGPLTVRVTVYKPGVPKVCFGFTSALEFPSPKFQETTLIVPLD